MSDQNYRVSSSGNANDLTSDPSFPKAKEAVEIKEPGELSLQDRRLFSHLIAIAYPRMMTAQEFDVHVSAVTKTGHGSHNSYDRLKNNISQLQKTLVTFYDPEKGKWQQTQLLGPCTISGGVLTFTFSAMLRPYLADPAQYSRISLKVLYHFQCKYSIPIYERLAAYASRHHNTCRLELEEFRQFIGIKDGQYSEFAQLKRRAIDKAIEEINKFSPIEISNFSVERKRRKVVAVNFVVRKKTEKELIVADRNQGIDLPLLH